MFDIGVKQNTTQKNNVIENYSQQCHLFSTDNRQILTGLACLKQSYTK